MEQKVHLLFLLSTTVFESQRQGDNNNMKGLKTNIKKPQELENIFALLLTMYVTNHVLI